MKLFGRKWRVTVGSLQSEDLDIRFKIRRTLQRNAGTCELDVYNLTESHRNEIRDAANPIVRVEAGYKDGMSMLFQGNERKTMLPRDGADWIAKITAGDGVNAIRTARGSRSFGPGTQLREVVSYLADAMGVGVGNTNEAIANASLDQLTAVFPRGTAIHGPAAQELTTILRSAGIEWSIQEGVLQLLPQGGALNREAVLLKPETGLIGVPVVEKAKIVKAQALLIPDLVPGRLARIESKTITGTYRIQAAEYAGDTRGDDWFANLELREVS